MSAFQPDKLGPDLRRIYDLRMSGVPPKEISVIVGWTHKATQTECDRMRRNGARFPRLKLGRVCEETSVLIKRMLRLRKQGLVICDIAKCMGITEGRVGYLVTAARREGYDVPDAPKALNARAPVVIISGTDTRGNRRRVIAATEDDARAAWALCGGKAEKLEVVR